MLFILYTLTKVISQIKKIIWLYLSFYTKRVLQNDALWLS